MEKLSNLRNSVFAAALLSTAALAGCGSTMDSYFSDPLSLHCDNGRTKSDLETDGLATFIVHGDSDGVAIVQVRRKDDMVSVRVGGDVTGPPQQLEDDGFTTPTPLVEGPELSAFGAGGAWIIDVRKDAVVIQGSCKGL